VEADPAVLILSPFETFFEEKRPFFIEGAKFFQHPDFNMFYSRRIGTGEENARIRLAGKLTGKTTKGVSLGFLAASTDLTSRSGHNPFQSGGFTPPLRGLVKEFADGNHRVNLMGTASLKTASRDDFEDPSDEEADLGSRDAYTGGLDFDLNFKNREYNIRGSWVGTDIEHEPSAIDSSLLHVDPTRGSGGHFEVRRAGGKLRGGVVGHWESDHLDLNDLGYLQAPDEIVSALWLSYRINPEGKSKFLNIGLELQPSRSWLYGGRTGIDVTTGEVVSS
jgi:hypothetical protein